MALTGKDVLRLLVDADTSGAVREFEKLGKTANRELGGAEQKTKGFSGAVTGGLDKLVAKSPLAAKALDKVGLSTSQLGAVALPALATGVGIAGGAVALFGKQSIDAFQETALAADKFRDATGLGLEDSSKWIAVADDVDVAAGTFQTAFVKMEKAIDTNRGAFGNLVVTARDGSTDLSATFLNVVRHLQGIEDPIKRANEASKFFGRGFAEVSEIITTDADKLAKKLGEVSEAQIIDEDEVSKARDYQAAMDTLGDAVLDLEIAFGEGLAPAVADVAEGLAGLVGLAGKLTGPIGGLGGAMDLLVHNAPLIGNAMNFASIFEDGASGVDRLGGAVGTFVPVFGSFIKGLDGGDDKANEFTNSMNTLSREFASAHGGAAGYSSAMQQINNANAVAADSTSMAREGVHTYGQQLKEAEKALRGLHDAQLAAIDSTFAVSDSYRQFQAANQTAGETIDDTKTAVNESQAAIDDAAKAALNNALAIAEMDRVQQEANKGTQTAKEKNDIMIDSLMKLAGESSPAVAKAIGGLITKLQTYDQTEADPELTATDNATKIIGGAQTALTILDGKSATVTIRANNENALRALDAVRDRITRYNGMIIGLGTLTRKAGGPIPGSPGQAVPIVAHGGEYVLSADVVDRIKRGRESEGASLSLSSGSSAGGSTVINFNGTFLGTQEAFGRMAQEAIAAASRRGNRAA